MKWERDQLKSRIEPNNYRPTVQQRRLYRVKTGGHLELSLPIKNTSKTNILLRYE